MKFKNFFRNTGVVASLVGVLVVILATCSEVLTVSQCITRIVLLIMLTAVSAYIGG